MQDNFSNRSNRSSGSNEIDPAAHATFKQHQGITGVLLMNLGTPEAPTAAALRSYLAEFLSDKRVIEIPKIIWWCILHFIILRVRPKKSAAKYQKIWMPEGSPLMVYSKRQAEAIQAQLGGSYAVKLAMRYGNPAIASTLREFREMGIRKIIALPLYPQYSATTTASCFDAIADELKTWRLVPQINFINNYCDHPDYIQALSNSITEYFSLHGKPEKLIFSYHGMPQRNLDLGDPYYCLCHKTTRLVAEKLKLDSDFFVTCFQSRFGYAEWLKPYTDETLKEFANAGIKNIAIISPAFSADCLETLEELAIENRDVFIAAGGTTFNYIPALNDRDDHIGALVALIKENN